MRRTTRDKWAKRVEAWKRSGVPIEKYAARLGINPKSLAWWKWQLASKPARKRQAVAAASFTPLTFVEVKASEKAVGLELVLSSGVCVRVPVDFDDVVLGRLLDVLERRK
jgi:hypothetical protein